MAANDNWPSSLAKSFAQAGAFPLAEGSKDAAVWLTLEPGAYTAVLNGVAGSSGDALIEIYEVR